LDGGGHTADEQLAYDTIRTKKIEEEGIMILRFWNHDVLNSIEKVLESIYTALFPSPDLRPPSPLGPVGPQGEGKHKFLLPEDPQGLKEKVPRRGG